PRDADQPHHRRAHPVTGRPVAPCPKGTCHHSGVLTCPKGTGARGSAGFMGARFELLRPTDLPSLGGGRGAWGTVAADRLTCPNRTCHHSGVLTCPNRTRVRPLGRCASAATR